MNRISAALITYNEAEKIRNALASLDKIADEIVIVDSFSSDATLEICRRYTDRIRQEEWQGYREQKQLATNLARYDWVLSLDADELLSPELRTELLAWKSRPASYDGYYLPRKTFFMGRWITHTTWHPDHQLRLFKKSAGRWEGGRVHESFQVPGPKGRFSGEIYHHTYSSLSEYLEQLERFSSLAALDYYENGERASWVHLGLYPPFVFFKNYLLRRGFLDGIPGLAVSIMSAVSTAFKYLKLWEIQSRASENS